MTINDTNRLLSQARAQLANAENLVGAARRQIEQVEAEQNKPTYPNQPKSTVVIFEAMYKTSNTTYCWAARRIGGRWYVTGSNCPVSGYSWKELIDWLRDSMQWVSEIRPMRLDTEAEYIVI